MKRFYKETSFAAAEGGYAVLLDGKPIRTPATTKLVVKSRNLAEARGKTTNPDDAPPPRLAGSVVDLVEPRRAQIIAEIARYAGTDLLCYRASTPPELATRQHEAWHRHLDWAGERYAPLAVTQGIAPLEQAPSALDAYVAAVAAY